MSHQTIAEIYEANKKVRANLLETVSGLSEAETELRLKETTWSIRQITEHLFLVEASMIRIIKKLLEKGRAENLTNDGTAHISSSFIETTSSAGRQKFSAPEVVVPMSDLTVSESLEKLAENRKTLEEMQSDIEKIGIGEFTFPHPSFGKMNAHDWLVLIGGHELRHLFQIKEILQTKQT